MLTNIFRKLRVVRPKKDSWDMELLKNITHMAYNYKADSYISICDTASDGSIVFQTHKNRPLHRRHYISLLEHGIRTGYDSAKFQFISCKYISFPSKEAKIFFTRRALGACVTINEEGTTLVIRSGDEENTRTIVGEAIEVLPANCIRYIHINRVSALEQRFGKYTRDNRFEFYFKDDLDDTEYVVFYIISEAPAEFIQENFKMVLPINRSRSSIRLLQEEMNDDLRYKLTTLKLYGVFEIECHMSTSIDLDCAEEQVKKVFAHI